MPHDGTGVINHDELQKFEERTTTTVSSIPTTTTGTGPADKSTSTHQVVDKMSLGSSRNPHTSSVGHQTPMYSPKAASDPRSLDIVDHFQDALYERFKQSYPRLRGEDEGAYRQRFEQYANSISDTNTQLNERQSRGSLPITAHFRPDSITNEQNHIPDYRTDINGNQYTDFSGSSTLVNPNNDETMRKVQTSGLVYVESDNIKNATNGELIVPPLSPLQPFTMMDPTYAKMLNMFAYNRFHIPVADVELRKCFRHIFISRPECYIYSFGDNGVTLSEQCVYDDDFASANNRVPHLLKLLSPSYVVPFTASSKDITTNWNMLLTNRLVNMGNVTMELSIDSDSSKSIDGFNVVLPRTVTSVQGGTLDLEFRDTKDFDVHEMLRLWILYMEKRHKGIFSPPYNGYQYANDFISPPGDSKPNQPFSMAKDDYKRMHPYDRAIEFPCTIFDIVTNESDTRILHITEYIGCYPVTVTNPYTNTNGGSISEAKVTATFRYQSMIENRSVSYIHFNYNTGIIDAVGNTTGNLNESLAFLMKDSRDLVMPQYIGAAGMWTGTPFVVYANGNPDPSDRSNSPFMPYLKFATLNDENLRRYGNLGIVNEKSNDTTLYSLQPQDPSVFETSVSELLTDSSNTVEVDNRSSGFFNAVADLTGITDFKEGVSEVKDAIGNMLNTSNEMVDDFIGAVAAIGGIGDKLTSGAGDIVGEVLELKSDVGDKISELNPFD